MTTIPGYLIDRRNTAGAGGENAEKRRELRSIIGTRRARRPAHPVPGYLQDRLILAMDACGVSAQDDLWSKTAAGHFLIGEGRPAKRRAVWGHMRNIQRLSLLEIALACGTAHTSVLTALRRRGRMAWQSLGVSA